MSNLETLLLITDILIGAAGIALATLAAIISVAALWGRARIKTLVLQETKRLTESFLEKEGKEMFQQIAKREANDMYQDLQDTTGITEDKNE